MPTPNESQEEALKRLDQRLGVAEAAQVRRTSPETHAAMSQGYRFVGEVVGGVLGGVGLGWLLDHYAGTGPWGMIGGLLIGIGLAIFAVVTAATRTSRQELAKLGSVPTTPDDEEDED